MEWNKMKEGKPEWEDLPFVTAERHNAGFFYELWDDTDWFFELTEKEQANYELWFKIEKPPKE